LPNSPPPPLRPTGIGFLTVHSRVDLPDSRYTLVPEGGNVGADGELQHVHIAQDLAQGQPCQRRQV
jgi:hypothetical protein